MPVLIPVGTGRVAVDLSFILKMEGMTVFYPLEMSGEQTR